MTSSIRAYRSSATQGATHIDALLACYDALVEDIRLAGELAAKGDVVARCRHSERAFLLIGHLESWVPLLDDPALGSSLVDFYQYLRTEILRLQISTNQENFMKIALTICETRAAWQSKQSQDSSQPSPVSSPRTCSSGEQENATSHFLVSV
jgi:flagellin-specific chaperone FliS